MTGKSVQGAPSNQRLTIMGVHLCAAAYPNTKFVVDHLRLDRELHCIEINRPLFRNQPFARARYGSVASLFKKPLALVRAIYCHADIFLRYWLAATVDVVYVPYPALGVLTVFSLLPKRFHPKRLIADAFISIYDTAVNDRGLLSPNTLTAKILLAAERRAYRTAARVVVDTNENRAYYAQLFGLPADKFAVVPLATDESVFQSSPYLATSDTCHVVFVGTFVPLQGTDVIARTIKILSSRNDIHFTIIGDGQTAESFAAIIGDEPPANLTWIKAWQDSSAVAKYIESADICLGIFSTGPKAQRVWPYKNYAYMTIGRAIVTADTTCAHRMLEAAEHAPFALVRPGDPHELAEIIVKLTDEPSERVRLARNARSYYDQRLANGIVLSHLRNEILFADAPHGSPDA